MAPFKRPQQDDYESRRGQPPAPVLKATETYKDALSQHWGPALRDLGFRGSGRIYVLPDERDWVMLGFQSSMASSAQGVKFTINLMVVGKDVWEAARQRSSYISAKPSPNTMGGPHRYLQRVGHLAHGRDYWWWLYAAEDPSPLIDEITQVIRDVAVPKLRQEMNDQSPGPRGTFENVARKQA